MVAAILAVCGAAAVLIFLAAVFVDNWNIDYEEFSFGEGDAEVRVAHLSDLHFPRRSVDCARLIEELGRRKVDFVAFTGDLICRNQRAEGSGGYEFMSALAAKFPVYFVPGNHEKCCADRTVCASLRARGVHVLEDETFYLVYGGRRLAIAGVLPGSDYTPSEGARDFTLLLAHHPERFARYAAKDPDLILAGHAHGGQIRLFGRGLYAPGQGLFPKYTSGEYRMGKTRMIVSRGLGKSRFPFRFNNRPHVPILTIKL